MRDPRFATETAERDEDDLGYPEDDREPDAGDDTEDDGGLALSIKLTKRLLASLEAESDAAGRKEAEAANAETLRLISRLKKLGTERDDGEE